MEIKLINKSHHPLPQYEIQASAGVDLRAFSKNGLYAKLALERSSLECRCSNAPLSFLTETFS